MRRTRTYINTALRVSCLLWLGSFFAANTFAEDASPLLCEIGDQTQSVLPAGQSFVLPTIPSLLLNFAKPKTGKLKNPKLLAIVNQPWEAHDRIAAEAGAALDQDILSNAQIAFLQSLPKKEIVGRFKKTDFSHLHKNLTIYKEEAQKFQQKKAHPVLVVPVQVAQTSKSVLKAEIQSAAQELLAPKLAQPTVEAPKLQKPFTPSVQYASGDFASQVSKKLAAKLHAFALSLQRKEKTAEKVELPEQKSAPQAMVAATTVTTQTTQSPLASKATKQIWDSPLQGRITVDKATREHLIEQNGVLEFFLIPTTDLKEQDLLPVTRYSKEDFDFNQKEFEFDARRLTGEFKLIALLFTPRSSAKEGRVEYHTVLNDRNAKEYVKFSVSYSDLVAGVVQPVAGNSTTQVTLSVFEKTSTESKSISFPRVRFLGVPEYKEITGDKHGDVILPALPIHSKWMLEISADSKYMPTTQVLSVGSQDPREEVVLINRSQAETLSFFVPGSDLKKYAVVMGQVFEPHTRTPLEGQRVEMLEHDSEKLSLFGFGISKDLKTQSLGFFSFFNVKSAIRKLTRPESDFRNVRWSTKAGYGYYLQLNRRGTQEIKGQLEDLHLRAPLKESVLGMLGDTTEFYTSPKGEFNITGIQTSSGRVAFEVRAPGYPLTWHTAPMVSTERLPARRFAMLSMEDLNHALSNIGSRKWLASTGFLAGKALSRLFKESKEIEAELRTLDGQTVSKENGPWPLLGQDPNRGITQESPTFAYWNLKAGEYVLVYKRPSDNKILHATVVDIGRDRVSVTN